MQLGTVATLEESSAWQNGSERSDLKMETVGHPTYQSARCRLEGSDLDDHLLFGPPPNFSSTPVTSLQRCSNHLLSQRHYVAIFFTGTKTVPRNVSFKYHIFIVCKSIMIRLGVGRRGIGVQFPAGANDFSLFHTSYQLWDPPTIFCNG